MKTCPFCGNDYIYQESLDISVEKGIIQNRLKAICFQCEKQWTYTAVYKHIEDKYVKEM